MEKPTYTGDDDGFDVMARLSATETLTAHLQWLWRLSCTDENRALGEHIIGCINDDGYLDTDLETLSEGLDIPLEQVEAVLVEIQNLEPAGVGARTLRECLRLQLLHREKGAKSEVAQLALKLIDDHWQPMARHSYEDIARKLKTSVERVQEGADFIRTELTPYPGRQFRPSWESGANGGAGRVRPDVENQTRSPANRANTPSKSSNRAVWDFASTRFTGNCGTRCAKTRRAIRATTANTCRFI